MIIAFLAVCLTLILGMGCSAYAQTSDIDSVLDKAQKSLSKTTHSNIAATLLEDYKTYVNHNFNVKMQYPADWTFNETGSDDIFPDRIFQVTFNSPFEVASDIVLLSVSIENLDALSTTLGKYKDRITNNVKNDPDAKDISISDTSLNGKLAYRLEYLALIDGSERKSIDVTSVNNGRVQEVSAFGEQPAIDSYSEEITHMIKSVKFGEPLIRHLTNAKQPTQITSESDVPIRPVSVIEDKQDNCDSSYPDFCIPPPPPNLNCPDTSQKRFTVSGSDPHGFDRDNDGVGCES